MPRVIVTQLAEIYKHAGSDNKVLQTFIDTASLIVDEELSTITPALSAARLAQIELYLAAHFAVMTYEAGGFLKRKINDVEEQYQELSVTLHGLSRTVYGQQVLLLDSSGRLNEIASPKLKASFRVVGSNFSTTKTEFNA